MSKGNVQLRAFVASYFKPGLSSNASVAEYTNLSNPMKDRNSPGKRVPPPHGSQSASTASTARKRTSLIKTKAALTGRDCILGAISSIILTGYRGGVGVDIFLRDPPGTSCPEKGGWLTPASPTERQVRAHTSFLGGQGLAFAHHTRADSLPVQLRTLWTLSWELPQEEPSATSPACACSLEQNSFTEVYQIFGMPVPKAILK